MSYIYHDMRIVQCLVVEVDGGVSVVRVDDGRAGISLVMPSSMVFESNEECRVANRKMIEDDIARCFGTIRDAHDRIVELTVLLGKT